jgi:hypothetical protein
MRQCGAEGVGAGIGVPHPTAESRPAHPIVWRLVLPSVLVLAGIAVLIWWFARRKLASPLMDEFAEYYSIQTKNREGFQHNFDSDIRVFKEWLSRLRSSWARVGTTRGVDGKSYVSLLPFSNILVRHVIFGFEHLFCYQSFLAWLTFRPGLEALLMIGKIVDDPANAKTWLDREVDFKAYRDAFWGKALESKSLVRSGEFRQVLTRLNDEFMHPNPVFAYRDTTVKVDAEGAMVEIQFFDVRAELHEAHLLAYLNLLDIIVAASESLVTNLCGPSGPRSPTQQTYEAKARSRAAQLAKDAVAKKIMQELGLWKL